MIIETKFNYDDKVYSVIDHHITPYRIYSTNVRIECRTTFVSYNLEYRFGNSSHIVSNVEEKYIFKTTDDAIEHIKEHILS